MIKISNHKMRLLWLKTNGLINKNNTKLDVLQMIKDLGFVQLDTLQNVTRAHHHILWSRNTKYKEYMIDDLLLKKENIFEHFTHDASILPIEFYPFWSLQFKRLKLKIDKSKYYKNILEENDIQDILNKIKNEGALHSKDFDYKINIEKKMWTKSTHKNTLDYLWYIGVLTTAYRKNFRKYYDLSENIIPRNILNIEKNEKDQINWLCSQALHRLSIANSKEIKNFWDVLTIKEVNTWIKENKKNILTVEWENNQGEYIKSYACLDIENRLNNLKNSNSKIKIINPFDPSIRDRIRLKAIFDFDYKIEIFVPKEKRVWGYYVYPLLQGNRFVGRIELQANRKENILYVLNFWIENEIIMDNKLKVKIDEELLSFALFIGIKNIKWVN